jgi:hypothetical protein
MRHLASLSDAQVYDEGSSRVEDDVVEWGLRRMIDSSYWMNWSVERSWSHTHGFTITATQGIATTLLVRTPDMERAFFEFLLSVSGMYSCTTDTYEYWVLIIRIRLFITFDRLWALIDSQSKQIFRCPLSLLHLSLPLPHWSSFSHNVRHNKRIRQEAHPTYRRWWENKQLFGIRGESLLKNSSNGAFGSTSRDPSRHRPKFPTWLNLKR